MDEGTVGISKMISRSSISGNITGVAQFMKNLVAIRRFTDLLRH